MRFRVDRTWRQFGDVVVAGSPLTMFRLSAAGRSIARRLVAGDDVSHSRLTERLVDAGALHPDQVAPGTHDAFDVTIVTPQLGGTVRFTDRVVVDDGSSPLLAGATIRLDDNRGPAAARNAGRSWVETSLVAFVDADVDLPIDRIDGVDSVASADWWTPLLRHFDDPNVGAVAPRVVGDAGSSLDLGADPARIRQGTRVSYVPAAAIIVRVDAFDDVGGFDEALRFGEDVDFVWRLDQAGWRCRYEPASTVTHQRRESVGERLRQQFGYGSSSAQLAMRHPGALAPFSADRGTCTAWLLAVAGHPLIAVGVAAAKAASLRSTLPDVPPVALAKLALAAHLHAGQHLARAVRRAWWPILSVACLVSRRARRVVIIAVAMAPHRLLGDVAFGAGLWSSMWRSREWRPIIPRITTGSFRQRRR